MPETASSPEVYKKFILDKCNYYKINHIKSYFSGSLKDELSKIIEDIKSIVNDEKIGISQKRNMVPKLGQKMIEKINQGLSAYSFDSKLDIGKVNEFIMDIDSALMEAQGSADLREKILLQEQQLRDVATQENQQLTSSRIKQLERELQESKAQLVSLQEKTTAKINSLESALQAETDENTRLKESLKDAQNLVLAAERRASAAEERVSEADEKAAVANGRVSAADASAAKAKQKEIELQQRLASQEDILQQASVYRQNLEGQLSAANARASQADSGSLQLREQIAELEGKLRLKDKDLQTYADKNTVLQSQIGSLTQQSEQKEADLKVKEESLKLAQLTNQTLSGENGNLRVNNERLASDNKTLRQQLEAQSLGLASQQNLTDRVTYQAEELKALQAKFEEADARAKAKEELAAELQRQSGSQATELKQFRDDNGALQSRLSSVESQLDEKTKGLAARDAELQAKTRAVEQQDEEIGRLKDKVLRLTEAQSLGATDKTALARLKALVEEKDDKIKQLESGNTALAAENTELKARNLDFEQLRNRNGVLIANNAALDAKVASLGAENERLKVQFTKSEEKQQNQSGTLQSLESENSALNLENKRLKTFEDANTTLQQQLNALTAELAKAKLEMQELQERNIELATEQDERFNDLMGTNSIQLKKIVELEGQLRSAETDHAAAQADKRKKIKQAIIENNQLKQQILDLQQGNIELKSHSKTEQPTSEPRANETLVRYGVSEEILQKSEAALAISEKKLQMATKRSKSTGDLHGDPAIGIQPDTAMGLTAEVTLPPAGSNSRSDVLGIMDRLEDVNLLSGKQATVQESGNILVHEYEVNDNDKKVKNSTYHAENTRKEFDNQKVGKLFEKGVITFDNEESPTEIRYTKLGDRDTIIAGAVNLECISKSQPDRGCGTVQATMKDCDDHQEFILNVLIEFHERLNKNLQNKPAAELENIHCTTIDYKGDNLTIRNMIDLHNAAAKKMNSGELKTKKVQAASILNELKVKREMASLAPKQEPDTRRRSSLG